MLRESVIDKATIPNLPYQLFRLRHMHDLVAHRLQPRPSRRLCLTQHTGEARGVAYGLPFHLNSGGVIIIDVHFYITATTGW